jgi:hypothetical protein
MRNLALLDDVHTKDMDAFICSNYITNDMSTMPTVDKHNVGSAMKKWMTNPSDFIGARATTTWICGDFHRMSSGSALRSCIARSWQFTYGTRALDGNLPENITETGRLIGESYGSNITFNATEANILRQTRPVYKTNWKWFTALLMCSTILLAAAYASLVLKYITLAPDIIAYASSLTLLNPYFPTPTAEPVYRA